MSFRFGFVKRRLGRVAVLAASGLALLGSAGKAQEGLDPSDIWYRGFLLVQAAEELENQKQYLGALNKLTEAQPLYNHLAQAFPEFQPEIVRERRHLIANKRDELKQVMRAQNNRVASGNPTSPGVSTPIAPPNVISPNPEFGNGSSRPRVNEGTPVIPPPPVSQNYGARSRDMEVESGNSEFALPSWSDGSSQALPRVTQTPGMPRVQTQRTPSVGSIANSLHEDLSRKDSLIDWLNDENQKLRQELAQRERSLEDTKAELAQARASREELIRQIQREEQNGIGLEAQKRIDQLKSLLRDATDQLEEVTKQNEQLVAALSHSQQEMKKLRDRVDELEKERDNLAEIVRGEGNGGRALKELMQRNQELSQQLDRAEQLASSLSELNKSKDEDIALLKAEITKVKIERDQLLAENLRHQQEIESSLRKLELLSDGLTAEEKAALKTASPMERQENELLRSIVLKQLRRQAQMKQAKELLLSQLDKVGARSETLLGLVEDMATGSQLTEEEKKLFKSPQFQEIVEAATESESYEVGPPAPTSGNPEVAETGDSVSATLIAPGTGPAADGVIRNQKVSVELAQIDKSARLDFQEGRLSEAEAGFLEYLRFRPKSVSCLCNLGVLKTSLKNYSEAEYYLEKALAIDKESGLAHYLLGRVYFLQGKLDDALAKLEEGITHDPQNAKAHNSVGVISTHKGWVSRAERAFTNAVSIDPKYGDAHFNLAVLHATKDNPDPKAAEKHYFEALHLGVPRDAEIEEFLKEAEAGLSAIGMR